MNLLRIAARVAAGGDVYNPRPGDKVTVAPLGGNKFRVVGELGGEPVDGVAETHRGGGLEFVPEEGSPDLNEDQYETLTDVMGDADPSWEASMEESEEGYEEQEPEPPEPPYDTLEEKRGLK